MKNKIIIFLALLAIGCKKQLVETPLGQVVGNNAVSSVEGLNAALTGSYQPLMSTWGTGISTAELNAILMGSDDITTHPASNKAELREFDQYNVTNTNGRLQGVWQGFYKCIQGTNNIITNYKTASGNTAAINQIAGEAFYLRAFSYYWLVRLWGNIPLVTTAVYDPAILKISSNTPADIYKLIESDLTLAETLMQPLKTQEGRASKGSASALLADVYLTEAGWPINDQTKYSKAAAKALEVINNKAAYGFDLVPGFGSLWADTKNGTATSEEVFALHFCGSCLWSSSNAVFGSAAWPGDLGGWDDYFSEINFFNNYPAGVRKDITFLTALNLSNGTTIPWQQDAVKHPYYQKFMVKNDWQTNATLPLIRYAHVLLIYAEAQARADGTPNTQSYTSINAIRTRAGLASLAGLSSADFQQAVIDERLWEFAGEYTRWFDIVRLQMLPQIIASRNIAENVATGPGKYYLPIPNLDVQLNPNIIH